MHEVVFFGLQHSVTQNDVHNIGLPSFNIVSVYLLSCGLLVLTL